MADCRQCGAKLPSFTFGEASPYCKTCRSEIVSSAKQDAISALPVEAAASTNRPLATYALLAINIAIFLIMVVSGVDAISPAADQVLRWGADYGPFTLSGQYWRLITSMFLHFGIIHIAANMWCLLSLGRLAEKMLGPFAVIGTYLLTGIGASLLSLSWNPMRVSAGASGAIFGIAGVLITTLYYGKHGLPHETVRHLLGYVVRFSLLNLLFGLKGHIDNMAHLGGLVSGLLIGLFLARTFSSSTEERNSARRTIFVVSTLVLILLFLPVAKAKQYAVEFDKGQKAFDKEDYPAAIEHMQKYTSERPDDDYGHAVLGASLQRVGRTDDAMNEYKQGLAINPEYRYIQINLAELYLLQNKPQQAIPLFEKGIGDFNDDAEVMYSYGKALEQTGNLSGAEGALRKSIHLDSKSIEARRLLSTVLREEGKDEEAKAEQRIADSLQTSKPSGSPDNLNTH